MTPIPLPYSVQMELTQRNVCRKMASIKPLVIYIAPCPTRHKSMEKVPGLHSFCSTECKNGYNPDKDE